MNTLEMTLANFKKIDILRNYVGEDKLALMIVKDSLELYEIETELELEVVDIEMEIKLEEFKEELNETNILNTLTRYLIRKSDDNWKREDDSIFVKGETECAYDERYLRNMSIKFLEEYKEKFEKLYSFDSIFIEEDDLTIITFIKLN